MNREAPVVTPTKHPRTLREAEPQGCLARAIGSTGYADCLTNPPLGCKHAMSFGYGYFCKHPQLKKIIEQTQQRTRH